MITIISNKTIHINVATIMTNTALTDITVITTIMTIIVLTSFVTFYAIKQTCIHVAAIVEILVSRVCTAIVVVKVTSDISGNLTIFRCHSISRSTLSYILHSSPPL